jgi:metal iron transporter
LPRLKVPSVCLLQEANSWQVIGTAIALNLLIPQIPLVAGCALSILEVMLILVFYRPNGSMQGLRAFEYFVMLLVLAVVVCFCVEISLIRNTSAADVLRGYLPSRALVEQKALYQACGILGATVMPHSLYLGSGIVQARLYDYDLNAGLLPPTPTPDPSGNDDMEDEARKAYIPSLSAIRCMSKCSVFPLQSRLLPKQPPYPSHLCSHAAPIQKRNS